MGPWASFWRNFRSKSRGIRKKKSHAIKLSLDWSCGLQWVDGLAWTELFTSDTLLPAFDRFASLSGLLVFAWVFELPVPRISKILLVIGSLFNLIVIFLVPNFIPGQGDPVPFNHTMIDAIWSLTSLFVVIVATVSLLTLRPKGWDQALGSFSILTLGVLLHISQGPTTASTAGFIHFAEVVAYPLFTIGATQKPHC